MNAPDHTIAPATLLPEKPYVGMRPFNPGEKDIFIGRGRDAVLLRDKVFSSRLTVLYGPSGIGKSSILRVLLIPELEEKKSRVICFDDWRNEDPTAALKEKLVAEAASLNIPEPRAGKPSLTDLVRLLLTSEDRTVVLILDQFEEFLDAPAECLESLRKELGTLVRTPDLNVRVLLSLREEHLAFLEPFRTVILNLFQSTYRLGPLDDDSVQKAIKRPAELFGANYEPGLMEDLVNDLRQEQQTIKPDQAAQASTRPVDLPMLQLVCDELWKETIKRNPQLETAKDKPITISGGVYKDLGGRQGILDRYLRRVMPDHWRGQKLTAQLMRYLAPRSGYKMAISAEDLADLTKFKPSLVQSELERLSSSKVRVLRSRQYGVGQVLYELLHDRFIAIIAPWRDDILDRVGRWRFIWRMAGLLMLASTVAVVVFWDTDRREFRHNTEDVLEKSSPWATKFEEVTKYLLQRRSDSKLTDKVTKRYYEMYKGSPQYDVLREFLKQKQIFLPEGYGIETRKKVELQETEAFPTKKQDKVWPLNMKYSSELKLDEQSFMQIWKLQAAYLTEQLRIPVPLKLQLVAEEVPEGLAGPSKRSPDLTKESKETVKPRKNLIKLSGKDIADLDFEIPTDKRSPAAGCEFLVAIILDNIPADDDDFIKKFKDFNESFKNDWQVLPSLEEEFDGYKLYRCVPRWSLPVWKHFKCLITDPSGIPALYLALQLKDHPDRLLTPDAVEVLLKKVAEAYPQAVGEARAARNGSLPGDFREIVKLNVARDKPALPDLPILLDALANYPGKKSAEIAGNVLTELNLGPASPPIWPSGPHQASGPQRDIHQAYQEAEGLLPKLNPPIRVYLGDDLVKAWTLGRKELSPELHARVEKIRDHIARRFGIVIPGVRFKTKSWDPELKDHEFRIEVFNQTKGDPDSKSVNAGEEASLEPLSTALTRCAESYCSYFLNADEVDWALWDLQHQKPAVVWSWLSKQYSLTDIKLLLKAVATPTKERSSEFTVGNMNTSFTIPLVNSIRQPGWLLSSLVFWSQVPNHDLRLLPALVRDLQATEGARMNRRSNTFKSFKASPVIEAGVRALGQGRLIEAQAAFSRALKADQSAAIASFLVLYPQELRRSLIGGLTASSQDLDKQKEFSQAERIELEDLVAEEDLDQSEGAQTALRLRLSLLASYPGSGSKAQRELVAEILNRYEAPEKWPPEEAAWFGTKLLAWFDLMATDNAIPSQGLVFLENALPRLKDPKAINRYADYLLKKCKKPGPNRWSWELLPSLATKVDLAMALDIAFYFANREVPADVKQALLLANLAKKRLPSAEIKKEERARLLDWAAFIEAAAILRLAELEEGWNTAEAEKTLLRLKDSASASLGNLPDESLAVLRRRQNRLDEAMAILDAAMKNKPGPEALYYEKLKVSFAAGGQEGVSQMVLMALGKVKKDKQGKISEDTQDFAALAAFGMLVTKTPGWEQHVRGFLQTDQGYVPYISMMMYWRLADQDKAEAQAVIPERWKQDKLRETWKRRLSQGDQTAWREMLIGRYCGKVSREEIFGDLENKARFAGSDLSQLPMTRQGMLCEAYFYEALLADANGDKAGSISSLKKAVETNVHDYWEYAIAQFLLAQQSEPK